MTTLKDKLSHLSYTRACKLLGPQGKQLILEGGKYEIDVFEQVKFNHEQFRLNIENISSISMRAPAIKPCIFLVNARK